VARSKVGDAERLGDLVRAGRRGRARVDQGTAHRGEDVLVAGGAEFGLDLPPTGDGRGTAARGDRVDPVVGDLDNEFTGGVEMRCAVRSVWTVTMCRNAFPRRTPATRVDSSFGTVVWLPVGSSRISVLAATVGTLSCHPVSVSPVRHRGVIPRGSRSWASVSKYTLSNRTPAASVTDHAVQESGKNRGRG
jgi:hypothetical protein